jgi:hypothetical protein
LWCPFFRISRVADEVCLWPKHADLVQTPLPVMAMVLLVLGIQFFLMGLLAEMLVRTYHESQAKSIYAVRERIGFREKDEG